MKRGDSYSVRYKYKDHSGKPCEGWESFKTRKEAQERKITVEKELLDGTFLVPDTMTVEEMLYKWIPIQSTKHKWSPKTYTQSVAMVQNLMHADVTIHKEETDQVWFNEARSISDFNSHLMIGEIMCTSFLADWVERAGKDPVLMKVIMERFNQFNQLYRYDDNFGWTHRYLTIREQGALLALNDLPAVTRETIARYLILQHTSLERQQKLFYCRESFLKQEYKLRLTPTELLELSLSLLASGKLEGDSKSVTQIGTVRFLADCLGLDFPANYDSLMYQLKEREQLTKFMDELRQSLIAYLRKKNG